MKVVSDAAGRHLLQPFDDPARPRLGRRLADARALVFFNTWVCMRSAGLLAAILEAALSLLEATEKLEQLRILEAGHAIRLGVTPHSSRASTPPATTVPSSIATRAPSARRRSQSSANTPS